MIPQTQDISSVEEITLTVATMANGGKAIGRDSRDRAIFVPLAIPGEKVRVEIVESKPRYAHANLVNVLEPSDERIEPRCPYFGLCGGCHFQHIRYPAQLQYKRAVIDDQLRRIGKLDQVSVKPMLANPNPWYYGADVTFSRTTGGDLGFWSPLRKQVIPIDDCHIIREDLVKLYRQIDLVMPSIHRLTLREGDGGELLASLEVVDNEEPLLNTDLPLSVTQILADGTTVNLVGDNYTIRVVKGRDFKVTAGCFFYPSSEAAEMVVDTVLKYAALSRKVRVLELNSGVGLFTAFFARSAREVVGIESNPEAVADLSVNLEDYDNVTLYQGDSEEVLPLLEKHAQLLVVHPTPAGLSPAVLDEIGRLEPGKIIYVSSDVATLARDSRRLSNMSYQPVEVQPIDMWPQTYYTLTVSLWDRGI
jgi:23S rRNA (uracil1939-C5)-methyltransferase